MLFSILWDVFKLIHALHGWLWSCEKIILAWKHVSRIKATTWRREQPNNIQVSSEWICYAVAKMKNLLKCHFGHNSTSMYCIGKIFSVLDSLQSLLSKYVTFWLIGCMQIYKKRALWGVGFFWDTLYNWKLSFTRLYCHKVDIDVPALLICKSFNWQKLRLAKQILQ